MSTYTQVQNDFISLCEQVGIVDTLLGKALECFDAAIAAGLKLLIEEEGLDEIAGKGKLKHILAHHAEKESEFWTKVKASRDKAPIKRRSVFANWKNHGAKAERAAALLDKIKEDTEALASASGNSPQTTEAHRTTILAPGLTG